MFATPAFSAWALANLPAAPVRPAATGAPRVALLLNCNARAVDGACVRRARALVGEAHVYASESLAQAEAMADAVVAGGYDVVACGGGDGTLADAINRVLRCAARASARRGRRRLPTFAFVPLGTGNALRYVVHSREPWRELRELVRGRRFATRDVPLVRDGAGHHFFFGGIGYDSLLLHDYNALLREPRPAWAQPLVRSWAGYVYALGRDTLPRLVREQAGLHLRVVARSRAHYCDPDLHDAPVPLARDSVLYEGPAGMLAVGTVPYFGYGMRVFPFADALASRRRPAMQLRVARLPAAQVLANLGAIWRGSYRNRANLLDFAVTDVEVQLRAPYPFERSGDDGGLVQQLRLQVAPTQVRLVDFARPLPAATRSRTVLHTRHDERRPHKTVGHGAKGARW